MGTPHLLQGVIVVSSSRSSSGAFWKAGPRSGGDFRRGAGKVQGVAQLRDCHVLDEGPAFARIEIGRTAAILREIEQAGGHGQADLFDGGNEIIAALDGQAAVAEGVVAHVRDDHETLGRGELVVGRDERVDLDARVVCGGNDHGWFGCRAGALWRHGRPADDSVDARIVDRGEHRAAARGVADGCDGRHVDQARERALLVGVGFGQQVECGLKRRSAGCAARRHVARGRGERGEAVLGEIDRGDDEAP